MDESALICDLAETYQIYDYRKMPVKLVATLAAGLRPDSRIMMAVSDTKVTQETFFLAAIVDRLNLLLWAQTKDAQKGRNRPKPMLDGLIKKRKAVDGFASGEDFEHARKKILKQLEGGGE